jgi:hypothetical protein
MKQGGEVDASDIAPTKIGTAFLATPCHGAPKPKRKNLIGSQPKFAKFWIISENPVVLSWPQFGRTCPQIS